LTNKLCGSGKNIIDKPIVLTIYSHSCPDLTLIDIPGITRNAIDDQTIDIEKVTKDMSLRYISDPKTIILAVSAANQDLSTTDSIPLAKKVDPKGDRTLGVLTKIDIMDRGTNARSMLMNEDVFLKLGFIGIKCRS